jgi:DNA-directed RNA polymerase subunit M/transcription elongation factor TFIIS
MPPDAGSWTVRCACGAALVVRAEAVGTSVTCAECKSSFGIVWARDAKSGARIAASAASVRIPQGAFEVRCECGQTLVAKREHADKIVKCPACARSMSLEKIRDPQTLQTRFRPKPAPAGVPSKAPSAGQDFLCSCGESLRVTAENLGKQGQCPHCGALMKLEKSRDPQTQSTELRVRVVGQAEPPPKPKPKRSGMEDWDLSDFQ